MCNLDIFPLISWSDISSVNLTDPDTEKYQSVYHVTDKTNNVSLKILTDIITSIKVLPIRLAVI
jgi:hypothetical protein